MKLHVNCIRVFEDMCKPYITSQIMIMDNNNMINGLKLEGGDPVSFAFDAHETDGNVYSQQQYILSIDGEESTDNLRTITYTIYTAGRSYFCDKANIVQMADVNKTGANLAARIHNQYVADGGLSLHSSVGMIAKDDIGGYHVNNKHPFKAIGDVLDRSVGSGVKTGSWMYFRDVSKHVICPLEVLFGSTGSQETFWQKQFGTVFEHTLQGADSRAGHNKPSSHAIMSAKTVVKELPGMGGGRGGGGNIAGAAFGQLNIHDITDRIEFGSGSTAGTGGNIGGSSALASVGRFCTGKFGGGFNVFSNDSRRNPIATNQLINAVAENSFQASVKDATHYLVKVPFQSGHHVTIGKYATAELIPPFGDVPGGSSDGGKMPQSIGGPMLVARVMHECYFDQRMVQGTTTMEMVSGYK